MIQIIDDRSTGKTMRLMLIAKERCATFICAVPKILERKAYSYGIVGIEFISFAEYIADPAKYPNVVIDEMPLLLKYYFEELGTNLIAYSASKE